MLRRDWYKAWNFDNIYESVFLPSLQSLDLSGISLLMEPDIFSHIFPKEVSMYKFFCMLILLFTRETVRSIALEGIRQTDFS